MWTIEKKDTDGKILAVGVCVSDLFSRLSKSEKGSDRNAHSVLKNKGSAIGALYLGRILLMRNDFDLIQRAVIRFTAVMLALFDCAGYALIFLAITVVFHFCSP